MCSVEDVENCHSESDGGEESLHGSKNAILRPHFRLSLSCCVARLLRRVASGHTKSNVTGKICTGIGLGQEAGQLSVILSLKPGQFSRDELIRLKSLSAISASRVFRILYSSRAEALSPV